MLIDNTLKLMLYNVSMETSELLTQLTQALTEAAHAHETYEKALAKLQPLETAFKEADSKAVSLMNAYMEATGASYGEPTAKRRGKAKGSSRPPRSLEAILMTTASRVVKAAQKDGKKKAEASKSVFESCQKIAVKRAEEISPELHGKIEGRINEIYGKK
jgi:hypothetical protein